MTKEGPTPVRYPGPHDFDKGELAGLLRNLAHGIEDDDIPLLGVETETEIELDAGYTCELTVTYTPSETILIPSKRLTDDE